MRRFKIILLIGVILITIEGLTGCGFTSEKKLKEIIQTALESKYEEEFVCLDVWSRGGRAYVATCSPKKNPDIRFEVSFFESGVISREEYYAACVAEKIEEKVQIELEEIFNDFYFHAFIGVPLAKAHNEEEDIYAQHVMEGSFELDEYIKLSGKDPVIMSFVVCVNTSAGDKNSFNEEYDKLYEVLSKIQALGVNTRLCLRFVPPNVYSECIKYLETYADTDSVFDDIIRDYPVKLVDTRSFVNFEEGELKLTKENYINQRKEAN